MIQRTLPAFLLALGLGALAGCASPTVITLNDGREIQAVDTPPMMRTPVSTNSNSSMASAHASTKTRSARSKSCDLTGPFAKPPFRNKGLR